MTNLETNRRIATLKGWTNINELGGSLIGTPPEPLEHSRGQRLVPDWTGDKAACFDLLVQASSRLEDELIGEIVTNWLAEFGENTYGQNVNNIAETNI